MAEKDVDYNFLITRKDWIKIQHYAKYAYDNGGNEIGGMMVLSETTYDDKIMYQMHHPVILEQEISGGNTVLTAEALAVHYGKMSDKFGTNIRHVWWHSHHKMGAFWSGTDDDTIMKTKTPDFSVSLVINLYQKYKLRVQWFKPFEHEENVPLLIIDNELMKEVPKYIEKEVEKLCSKRASVVSGHVKGNVISHGGYHHAAYGGQSSLWDMDDPADPEFPASPTYMMVYDWIDGIVEKLIKGEIEYKSFRKVCEESNMNLKSQGNPFRIKLIKKKVLEEEVYTMNPRDFIERKGGTYGRHNYAI